jgi:methanogenic corrinoid protein MtbC1
VNLSNKENFEKPNLLYRGVAKMAKELVKLISDLKEREALEFVQKKLDESIDPLEILEEAREGLKIVGERFSCGDYFIPDLVFSGEILKRVAKLAEPYLKAGKKDQRERRGKVIIGTVRGDIHDIGKNMVVFFLDTNGYEVFDLGIDVPAEKFVQTIRETGGKIIGLSGFLTLAFDSMKETIEAIKGAHLRDKVKIMIGGGQIDEQVMTYTGADAYGLDAMAAVKLADQWIGG